MNVQSFGHLFGILFKRIDQRLFFIPKKLRKLVMIILSFVGLPLFLLFFLVLRGWLYRKVSLYEKGELLYPTNQAQEIIEELQDINQRLDKYRKYDDNIIGSGNGTGNGINF
jgi:hypothetical protein